MHQHMGFEMITLLTSVLTPFNRAHERSFTRVRPHLRFKCSMLLTSELASLNSAHVGLLTGMPYCMRSEYIIISTSELTTFKSAHVRLLAGVYLFVYCEGARCLKAAWHPSTVHAYGFSFVCVSM